MLLMMLISNALVIEGSIAIGLVLCTSGELFSSLLISINLLLIQKFGMFLFFTQSTNMLFINVVFILSISLFSLVILIHSPGTLSIPVALFLASVISPLSVLTSYFSLFVYHLLVMGSLVFSI